MGRGKLPMELIPNEKSRNSTFKKRKTGLKKKLYEFTTLCGVDACMIIYGPYHDGRHKELDIWPSNPFEVTRIIDKYKSKGAEGKAKRDHDLSHFFKDRKNKINDDIVKLQRANAKAKYPGWDHRFCDASLDELGDILHSIESRMDHAKIWTETVHEKQPALKKGGGAQKMKCCTNMQSSPQIYSTNNMHGTYQRNVQLEENNHLQESSSLDGYMPAENYTFDKDFQTRPSFEINSRTSPTMMMLMNEDYPYGSTSNTNLEYTPLNPSIYYDPYGSTSNTNLEYTPLKPSIYYDPYGSTSNTNLEYTPSGLLENVIHNNFSVGYYSSPSMQLPVQQQFVQRPIIPNASQVMMSSAPADQVNDPQVHERFYEDTDFQSMNKRGRYY